MEVYFLDVGQGTSQLLLLGNGEAIVIDAGPQADNVLLKALERYSVDRIVRLILSHSHRDHIAAASRVLTTYTEQIEQLWFLDDSGLRASHFFSRVRQMVTDGELSSNQLKRIETDDAPREMYADDQKEVKLSILSPTFATNIAAIDSGNANATSAVLVLDVHGSRIVFAADSTMQQWRTIRKARDKPLCCDIVAVPHHGGDMGQSTVDELLWLYQEAINTKHGVISVGTRGGVAHGHPKGVVVSALRESGASVLCTQLTEACCNDLEKVRRGLLYPLEVVRQSLTHKSVNRNGKSQRVACAGSVVAEVDRKGCVIRYLDTHQQAVDALANEPFGSPLCRGCETVITS